MKTKYFFAILTIASALTIAVVVANQKARAQNSSPRPKDKTGAVIDDAAGGKESSPIFVTEIPPGYRDWRVVSAVSYTHLTLPTILRV